MHLEHVKHDLSHGFPADWGTSKLEKQIVEILCRDDQFDLVVNATWGFLECKHPVTNETSDKFRITKDLVLNHGVRNVLFFNFVDPLYEQSTWYDVLNTCKEKIGEHNIKTVGFIDTNKFKQDRHVDFWAIYNDHAFMKYDEKDLLPSKFENIYLCYKVILINRDKKTKPFANDNIHGNLNIPNDTLSVGPLDAWNSSFLVIVTETDHNMNTAVPFLSEKIWKPLIGMRPFVCLGDKGTIGSLKEAGFETFNEFFGVYKDDLTVDDITNLVKRYQGDPAQDYETLRPKLIGNRRRFFEYAREQKQTLGL
jgi:hypothetical protein